MEFSRARIVVTIEGKSYVLENGETKEIPIDPKPPKKFSGWSRRVQRKAKLK